MTSDVALEVAKYPQSNPKITQNNARAYCLAPLAMQFVIIVIQFLFVDAIIVNRY